jgi:hypothetical protein
MASRGIGTPAPGLSGGPALPAGCGRGGGLRSSWIFQSGTWGLAQRTGPTGLTWGVGLRVLLHRTLLPVA